MQAIYRIRVQNQLEDYRAEWFEGMKLVPLENGETELSGPVSDQEELHRVLRKIRDLNLRLVALERLETEAGFSEEGTN